MPWLDAAYHRIRQGWARERRIWDKKQWREVLYTDETSWRWDILDHQGRYDSHQEQHLKKNTWSLHLLQ